MQKIKFNDIPKYTNLTFDLIYQKKIKRNTKTSVLREYNNEKWQEIINKFQNKSFISFEEIIFAETKKNDKKLFYKKNEGFIFAKNEYIVKSHLDLYQSILEKYTNNASGLVELGAGFGAKLIDLSRRDSFKNIDLYAGELTASGQYLINYFSNKLNIKINTQFYDFRSSSFKNFKIPENCVIFTSYALCYVPILSKKIIRNIINLKPKAIVFFEPCYEHHDQETVHGLYCRKYIEVNDYIKNLHSIINEFINEGSVNVKINKNVIGSNPFLPISIIEIQPIYN